MCYDAFTIIINDSTSLNRTQYSRQSLLSFELVAQEIRPQVWRICTEIAAFTCKCCSITSLVRYSIIVTRILKGRTVWRCIMQFNITFSVTAVKATPIRHNNRSNVLYYQWLQVGIEKCDVFLMNDYIIDVLDDLVE